MVANNFFPLKNTNTHTCISTYRMSENEYTHFEHFYWENKQSEDYGFHHMISELSKFYVRCLFCWVHMTVLMHQFHQKLYSTLQLPWKWHQINWRLCVCVWCMADSKSVTTMQRKFRTMYGATPCKSILRWWSSSRQLTAWRNREVPDGHPCHHMMLKPYSKLSTEFEKICVKSKLRIQQPSNHGEWCVALQVMQHFLQENYEAYYGFVCCCYRKWMMMMICDKPYVLWWGNISR
jgi:hypothetical protein